ncbi:MAG: SPOR domain-containing protein [Ignavibacterium sp.]|nr:MAG: SPOR domain-containing protein [Ignavibacterium sp.]
MSSQNFKLFYFISPLLIILSINTFPQDVNIIPYLKQIESGKAEDVRYDLMDLKERNPESPSVMFLDGVLTENGQKALLIYQNIVDKYPNSKYADAALYRIYSYYYALGLYESASKKLSLLINNYPASPYINIAKQNQLLISPDIEKEEDKATRYGRDQQTIDDVSGSYKYTIQAGAFSNRENARSLQDNFEKSGLYSQIIAKQVAGTTFHIVYVGRFVTNDEAEDFLRTINTKFNLTGRVVTINQ